MESKEMLEMRKLFLNEKLLRLETEGKLIQVMQAQVAQELNRVEEALENNKEDK